MNKNIDPQETLLYGEDHLRMIFEHFFKFVKYGGELQPEYIRDALNGALSGLKYGFDRGYYLKELGAGIQMMIEVTNHELQNRPSLNKTYRSGEEYKEESKYVYGLSGLRELLNISHTKASQLANSEKLEPAIIKTGREYMFETEKVLDIMRLSNQPKTKRPPRKKKTQND